MDAVRWGAGRWTTSINGRLQATGLTRRGGAEEREIK